MYNLLIVEDCISERDALKNCVDWSLIGINIVGVASNGLQGIEMFTDLNPDIILTDVKMNGMDGINMAKNIRELNPNVQIIFLSSYDDFEYAQKAITINACAYLTKPVDEFNLLKTVKMAIDKCKNKESKESDFNRKYSILAQQALIHKLLSGLINEDDKALIKNNFPWIFKNKNILFNVIFNDDNVKTTDILQELFKTNNICCIQISNSCIIGIMNSQQISINDVKNIIYNHTHSNDIYTLHNTEVLEDLRDITINYYDYLNNCINSQNSHESKPEHSILKQNNKSQIVDNIKSFIHEHLSEQINVQIIAKELHFTPNYISTIFKSTCKESISSYIMNERINKAINLLSNTKLSINEISDQCGYENVTYFYIQFKKVKNITPAEFRKTLSGEHYEMDAQI